MAKLIVWRYDGQKFEPGYVMKSRGDHLATLDPANKAAELDIRAALKAGERIRSTSLYTWRDEAWARTIWRPDIWPYLYKLEIDTDDIVFTSDLCHYTDVRTALYRGQSAAVPAERYVRNVPFIPLEHFKPRIEILVTKATVLKRFEKAPKGLFLGLVRARTSGPRWA